LQYIEFLFSLRKIDYLEEAFTILNTSRSFRVNILKNIYYFIVKYYEILFNFLKEVNNNKKNRELITEKYMNKIYDIRKKIDRKFWIIDKKIKNIDEIIEKIIKSYKVLR